MATAIQFWGKDRVLQAYDSRDVETWAIFTGKEMITRGTGREDLSTFLSMLSDGYSNAVYTLKIYDGIDEAEVKDNTPCDGSFRFSLSANGVAVGGQGGIGNEILLAKIAALEKKLAEPDEQETIGSVFMGLLKDDPMKIVHLVNGVKSLLGFNVPTMAAGTTPVLLAGRTEELLDSDDERRERLVKALDVLGKNDPKFLEHLEKLAAISEKNPATFQGLLTMLSNF